MILVWQITDDLPNSPYFPPAKLSRYTVFKKMKVTCMFLIHMEIQDTLLLHIWSFQLMCSSNEVVAMYIMHWLLDFRELFQTTQ